MSRRGKIIYFTTVDWFFCSHFMSRANAAKAIGYEVIVVTNVDRHGEVISNAGFRLIPLQISRSSFNPITAFHAVVKLANIYRQESPDIIHLIALKPILLGGLAARFFRKGCVLHAIVGLGYIFASDSKLAYMLRPFINILLRLVLNQNRSKVIFENQDDLEDFVKGGLVVSDNAVLIRGAGVDPKQFKVSNGMSEPPLIVFVGRLLWHKGVGEFVQAARLLRQRGYSARFIILGKPDPENRASIDSDTVEAWRAEGIVELWGFRDDIAEILAGASIACLPSSHREGLPKSLLEAMAAGLPCITTNVPGCREAVRDGDNGILVPEKNAYELATAIEYLIQNPSIAKSMGLRGRERVQKEFSIDYVNAATIRLYDEVLNNCSDAIS